MFITRNPLRFFTSILLVVSLILSPFSLSLAQATKLPQCKLSFSSIKSLTKDAFKGPSNIFSESLPSTIISSTAMLASVQAAKYLAFTGQGADFFTTAFLVTVPLDIGLTLVSHWITLGKIPWLKKFAEGKVLGPRYEFWSRVAANVTVASTGIVSSWAVANQLGAGIEISAETISAAILLCMLVYPSLQVTKPFLFKQIPRTGNEKRLLNLESTLGGNFPLLDQAVRSRASELKVSEKETRALFTHVLERVILLEPWENQFDSNALSSIARDGKGLSHQDLALVNELSLISEEITQLKKGLTTSEVSSRSELVNLRRGLVFSALELGNSSEELKSTVKTGLRFSNLSSEDSIGLFEQLRRQNHDRKARILLASMADQAIAVGFAGGVLLYSTTHWAQAGELPIFLMEIIK